MAEAVGVIVIGWLVCLGYLIGYIKKGGLAPLNLEKFRVVVGFAASSIALLLIAYYYIRIWFRN